VKHRYKLWLVGIGLLATVLWSGSVPTAEALTKSISPSVSADVSDTALVISGLTSPYAFVQFINGNGIIGSVTADANGHFEKTFNAQRPGIHTLSLIATDTIGRITEMVQVSVNLLPLNTTTFEVFLSSTMSLSAPDVQVRQQLGLAGETIPRGHITIIVDGLSVANVAANERGKWLYQYVINELSLGRHTVSVIVQSSSGQQSRPTAAFPFTVISTPLPGAPTKPAIPTITSPKTGDIVDVGQITITGRGQPGTQIEVWNHGQPIGSAIVGDTGDWSVPISLTSFAYEIVARACVQGVCSDFSSPPVSFMLKRLPAADTLKLLLNEYMYYGDVTNPIILNAHIINGKFPYRLSFDWGDGITNSLATSESYMILPHEYDNPGKYKGKVTLIDAAGSSVEVHFSADMISRGFVWYWWYWLLPVLIWLLLSMHLYGWIRLRRRAMYLLRKTWYVAKRRRY
jgi:hypothetical protein